jgi:hypothetical protein
MGRAQSRQRPRVFRREDSAPLHPLSLPTRSRSFTQARGILDDAENDGQIALSLQAIAELRRTVELLAKLTGEIDERPAEGEARITQETGAMIANVFIAVFADNSLGLDFDTQHQGREVAARHLRAIASEDPQTS